MSLAVAAAPVIHRQRGVVRIEAALTCNASGVVNEAVIGAAFGRLVGVFYDGGLDIGAVITVKQYPGAGTVSVPVLAYTTGTEGVPVSFRPTDVIATNAGVDVVAALTAVNVNRDIYLAGKVTVAVTGGGISETARLALIVDEDGLGELSLAV